MAAAMQLLSQTQWPLAQCCAVDEALRSSPVCLTALGNSTMCTQLSHAHAFLCMAAYVGFCEGSIQQAEVHPCCACRKFSSELCRASTTVRLTSVVAVASGWCVSHS